MLHTTRKKGITEGPKAVKKGRGTYSIENESKAIDKSGKSTDSLTERYGR